MSCPASFWAAFGWGAVVMFAVLLVPVLMCSGCWPKRKANDGVKDLARKNAARMN